MFCPSLNYSVSTSVLTFWSFLLLRIWNRVSILCQLFSHPHPWSPPSRLIPDQEGLPNIACDIRNDVYGKIRSKTWLRLFRTKPYIQFLQLLTRKFGGSSRVIQQIIRWRWDYVFSWPKSRILTSRKWACFKVQRSSGQRTQRRFFWLLG